MRLLRDDGRLARHLQVPLQSGSDRILKRMRRNYRTAEYLATLESLRAAVPEIGLGADVIVGFPGETDEDFAGTRRFIESSPLNYLHVFPYSDRPGTPASGMDGHVPPEAIRARSAGLRALGAALGLAFRRSFIGRTLPALVMGERLGAGRWRALTDNFIDLAIDAPEECVNRIIPATILGADGEGARAVPAPSAGGPRRPAAPPPRPRAGPAAPGLECLPCAP